jgi:hypothetical protein
MASRAICLHAHVSRTSQILINPVLNLNQASLCGLIATSKLQSKLNSRTMAYRLQNNTIHRHTPMKTAESEPPNCVDRCMYNDALCAARDKSGSSINRRHLSSLFVPNELVDDGNGERNWFVVVIYIYIFICIYIHIMIR